MGKSLNMPAMEFATLDMVFNALLLVFWLRIWTSGDSRLFFNPHIAPINRFSESVLTFFWPVFRRTPSKVVATIIVVALLAIRGLAVPESVVWGLSVGFEYQLCAQSLACHMMFSVLSFLIFLFKIWGFSLIYARIASGPFDHAGGTLRYLSLPFSDVKMELRPLALAVFGMGLAFLLNVRCVANQGWLVLPDSFVPAIFLKYFISAFACWASVLPVLSVIIVILIVGSWISLFSNSSRLAFVCREWLDMLMGPLRNYPIRIGMLDLTPLVLIFAIQWLYPVLLRILSVSYERLG
jgi:uncharacterized protein YggT (Ycf19 family)